MKKVILFISSMCIMVACGEPKKVIDPTMLNPSASKVKIIIDPIILKDSSTYFKIIPETNEFKIIEAYFDCGREKSRQYDTLNNKIKGCDKRLVIENDSVKIYLEPNILGRNKFEDITLLLQDKEGNKSFIDTTFYYEVK